MNLDFLNPYMFWIKVGGAVLVVIAIFSGGMWLEGTIKQHEIDGLKLEKANKLAQDATTVLQQFEGDVALLNIAAAGYVRNKTETDKRFDALSKALQDAFKNHPLPADCRPDVGRMLSLTAAVAAANGSPAGHAARPAVPATP